LLIAEGHRIPGVLAKWNAENLRARKERQAMLDQLVASGGLKASPITENFEFAMTPLVYVAVAHMILGDSATKDIQEIKDTHRKVLHMLLKA
jgi:hypothetical protein